MGGDRGTGEKKDEEGDFLRQGVGDRDCVSERERLGWSERRSQRDGVRKSLRVRERERERVGERRESERQGLRV